MRAFAPLTIIMTLCAGLLLVPSASFAAKKKKSPTAVQATGGAGFGEENPHLRQAGPGDVATLQDNGLAVAPENAPDEVKAAIWAANEIVGKPYIYGGGHRSFKSRGYDCSGTVSYALNGGDLLDSPLDSSSFMKWGEAGEGEWITVYTNPGHAFVVIAGLRLDTSAAGDPSGAKGPRWRPALRSTKGFKARHPEGF
ncbi:C40 family peptidase [Svornostia abyssi]|uniref:C40 family peptidase n=1 Tax=Svornostia abyssi TaxID=2898438 RepID=A0ABY5PF40_9ACTN|nr:C40 family peptidase [Parviterribacteraceae bacterium J379]